MPAIAMADGCGAWSSGDGKTLRIGETRVAGCCWLSWHEAPWVQHLHHSQCSGLASPLDLTAPDLCSDGVPTSAIVALFVSSSSQMFVLPQKWIIVKNTFGRLWGIFVVLVFVLLFVEFRPFGSLGHSRIFMSLRNVRDAGALTFPLSLCRCTHQQ